MSDQPKSKDSGPLAGFRDLMSGQMLARNKVIETIASVYELYGFMPIKTPAIEKYETLSGKYGDEANLLMYDLKDRGGRHLALRYDHTVPLARLIASRGKSLPSPYKRYVVGDVWRGESPQAGRYREFAQIDADIVGSSSYLADVEILAMTDDVMSALGLEVTIGLNDRRLLDGLASACGVKETDFYKFVGIIDKLNKVGLEATISEIEQKYGQSVSARVKDYLMVGTESKLDEVIKHLDKSKAQPAIEDLKKIMKVLSAAGHSRVKFNPAIARGLNYYSSTIFETYLDKLPGLGSICSGGRYDSLIESLGGDATPAVGTSVGVDRLMEGVNQLGLAAEAQTRTRAYITNLDPSLDVDRFKLAQKLRNSGLPTELYYEPVKLGKQLASIDKLGVNEAVIYGSSEHSKGIVVIKDLKTSSQREVELDKLSTELSKDK